MRIAFPVLALVLALGAPLAAQEKIRLFVKPTAATVGGFVDEESKRLTDSRADFVKHLTALTKKEAAFVDEGEADVVLELNGSRRESFGRESTTRSLFGGTTTDVLERPTVHVRIAVGDYSTDVEGAGPFWKSASIEAAVNVRKWLRENRATVLAKRAQQ